jgi:hypothetical protein
MLQETELVTTATENESLALNVVKETTIKVGNIFIKYIQYKFKFLSIS